MLNRNTWNHLTMCKKWLIFNRIISISNTLSHLTVCKEMSSTLFKNQVLSNYFLINYIYIYIGFGIK